MFELGGKRIWVAGHRGMVGSALVRRLSREACEILTVGRDRADLRRQDEVEAFIKSAQPDAIILAAAKVGGIAANDAFPADFLADNLAIQTNVVRAAHEQGVQRLLFIGSSCIYPKLTPQPISEDALLTGPLEATNEWYAIAKIAGVKLTQAYRRQHGRDYISAMPTNLYGPGDNFDLSSSHVLPALIRKAHEAKMRGLATMTLWGTGTPRREFLHVDDCADALVFLLKNYSAEDPINVGTGDDLSILELAQMVSRIVGFRGTIEHDLSKPNGTPRKLLDTSRLTAMGWSPRIGLEEGIARVYAWYCEHHARELAA
jgi:GDP-L-fucose synthase